MASHRLFITLLVFVLMGAAAANGHKYMMCKTVEDIFASTSNSGSHNHSSKLQGPPGKRGPIGRPGLRGPIGGPGPQGTVDYQMVNDTIDAKIQKVVALITTIEEKVRNLSETIDARHRVIPSQNCKVDDGVVSRGSCFFHLMPAFAITYERAKALCRQRNAILAEFQDRSQQTELQDALRVKIQSGSPEFWIGMKYRSSGQQLEYLSGRQVSYNQFDWHSGRPTGNYMYLSVEVDKTNLNHGGLLNHPESSTIDGALCEKHV